MNKVILHGNLTKEPETKTSGKGKKKREFTTFSLAVNERDDVDYFNCIAFGKTGELLYEHFTKGSEVLVLGRIKNNTWTDDYDNNHYDQTIFVDSFDFCGKKDE